MSMSVIIDAILVGILILFLGMGARRGLFRALAGFLILVIALVGAGWIANTLSAPAEKILTPVIEKRVTARVQALLDGQLDLSGEESAPEAPPADGTLPELPVATDPGTEDAAPEETPAAQAEGSSEEADTAGSLSLEKLLDLVGTAEDAGGDLVEKAQEKLEDAGTAAATALAEDLAHSMIYGGLFFLTFLALLLVLNLLARAVDLFLKLPVLHGANALCGAVVGLVEGVLFLFLMAWVAGKLDLALFTNDLISQTIVLKFFMENTPLSAFAFLR